MPNGSHRIGHSERRFVAGGIGPARVDRDIEPDPPLTSRAPPPPIVDGEVRSATTSPEDIVMAMAPPFHGVEKSEKATKKTKKQTPADRASFQLRGYVRDMRADAQNLE